MATFQKQMMSAVTSVALESQGNAAHGQGVAVGAGPIALFCVCCAAPRRESFSLHARPAACPAQPGWLAGRDGRRSRLALRPLLLRRRHHHHLLLHVHHHRLQIVLFDGDGVPQRVAFFLEVGLLALQEVLRSIGRLLCAGPRARVSRTASSAQSAERARARERAAVRGRPGGRGANR